MKQKLIAAALALALLTGCSGNDIPISSKQPDDPQPSPSREPVAVEKVTPNGLVLRLLELESQKAGEDNVILSPLSIEMALGMAANGAAGEAREALETLLGLTPDQLNTLLGAYLLKGDNTLSMANSMWFNENTASLIREDFTATLREVYDAGEGSFAPYSQADANAINAWVKEKTNGKIDAIITPDALAEDTMALLLNALYFNGKWTSPFREHQLTTEFFFPPTGGEMVTYMNDWLDVYFETEWGTGFAKDYEEGYEFVALLPKSEGGVDLSWLNLDEFLATRTGAYDVSIKIPKFELEYATSLRDTLTDLGLGSLFDATSMNAMLTDEALATGRGAHVSDVVHKAYMKMYEEGTEAAAVTGVIVTADSAPAPKEMKEVFLDRPFAFLIRDTASGQVVFCGVINHPLLTEP